MRETTSKLELMIRIFPAPTTYFWKNPRQPPQYYKNLQKTRCYSINTIQRCSTKQTVKLVEEETQIFQSSSSSFNTDLWADSLLRWTWPDGVFSACSFYAEVNYQISCFNSSETFFVISSLQIFFFLWILQLQETAQFTYSQQPPVFALETTPVTRSV
jgi:hypothetical protein